MEYTKEFSVDDFKFWSGAKDTVDDVRRAGKMDELQSLIEEQFAVDETPPSETTINDFVWFERNFIYEQLGLDENGEVLLDDEDDEDEDDEDYEDDEDEA